MTSGTEVSEPHLSDELAERTLRFQVEFVHAGCHGYVKSRLRARRRAL